MLKNRLLNKGVSILIGLLLFCSSAMATTATLNDGTVVDLDKVRTAYCNAEYRVVTGALSQDDTEVYPNIADNAGISYKDAAEALSRVPEGPQSGLCQDPVLENDQLTYHTTLADSGLPWPKNATWGLGETGERVIEAMKKAQHWHPRTTR